MFYYLHELTELFSPLRIFRYITVRALAGASTAFIISLVFGPYLIRWLRRMNIRQESRTQDVPSVADLHRDKSDTPTMGGLLIIIAVTVSTLLWSVPTNGYVVLTLLTFIVMGLIGFCDDYLKLKSRNSEAKGIGAKSKGLGAKQKLAMQLTWTVIIAMILLTWPATRERTMQLMVPFIKDPVIQSMGVIGTIAFLFLVLVGSTNAVNLTDGLDGLAIGCTSSVAIAYLVMAYVAGHVAFSEYLFVPYVADSGELAVFCGCLLGASLGFLWYNCHPAQVFMGDTGSLALGGAIAMVAILIKQELVLIIVGGVFVMEAISVLMQVGYYKLTKKRIFRCAPIHHHFESLAKDSAKREGRDLEVVETMVTIRFWILSIIFALLGVATLKIR